MDRKVFLRCGSSACLKSSRDRDIWVEVHRSRCRPLWVTDLAPRHVTAKWETKWWCQISALMWWAFKEDEKLLFNPNNPFHPHQILTEGCQCSTTQAHTHPHTQTQTHTHCRAPGNQWAWTMTQHHLANRQVDTVQLKRWRSGLIRTLLWILRHLLKVFARSSRWIYPKCLKQQGRRWQIEMLGV